MRKLREHIIRQIWEKIFESTSKNAMPVNEQNQQIILLLENYNLYQYLIEPGSQLQWQYLFQHIILLVVKILQKYFYEKYSDTMDYIQALYQIEIHDSPQNS